MSWTLRAAAQVALASRQERKASIINRMIFDGTQQIRRSIKRKLFGENFAYAVSGGAKLNPDVSYFFDSLQIEIVEGYGLTETCVATNCNRPGQKKIGTVGPVLSDDIELRLAQDGEILFRGPNVASGYLNRKKATADSWDQEGWYHTGDIGSIDVQGFLSIVGRKKEILVTSYGKNIAPDHAEQLICSSEYISQALLYGDGRPYCVALIVPDKTAVAAWAESHQVKVDGVLHEDIRLSEHLWSEVQKANQQLSSHESVKKIAVISEDFSVENGLLTPTLKMRRARITEKYKETVEQLYKS